MSKTKLWRCDGGDDHFLIFTAYHWNSGPEAYLEVSLYTGGLTILERIKAAWRLLVGNQMHLNDCIILSPDDAKELVKELEDFTGEDAGEVVGGDRDDKEHLRHG